jgi:hypothetical protein
MNHYSTIYQYITAEEENYKQAIDLMGWDWSMYEHIKKAFFYKHGRLLTGNDQNKPVKNIIRPILNLQYRTEDIDVKDIYLYIDNKEKYHLSFLIKKYHDEVFVKEHDLDTLWDKTNESRIDYGGGLLKKVGGPVPEVVPLSSIAFCDQTDMLSGPIGIKHYYSPDQLLEMADYGWGDEAHGATISLEELITLANHDKETRDGTRQNKTPGKYIEIYEVHGTLPAKFLNGDDEKKYIRQMQIAAFYTAENGMQEGVTLFKGEEKEEVFKLTLRDEVDGRALGFGGVEELEEPQVWVNYNQIRFKDMLDAAAKTLFQTDDAAFANRNKISGMKNMEIAVVEEGKTVRQIDTFPRNIQLFQNATQEWEQHAQQMGAANDSIMGKNPASGTPFKLQELVVQESQGLHDHRRGKFAKFVEIVYREWIIPHIIKEITKGSKFLAELTFDEMQEVSESVIKNQVNKLVKEKILNGEVFDEQELEAYRMMLRDDFMASNKKFVEILKDEFKGMPINISINVAGKQKALAAHVDKLVNVFRQVASAPQLLEDPRLSKLFNQILEASGLSPIDFGTFKMPAQQMAMAGAQANATEPIAGQAETINQ